MSGYSIIGIICGSVLFFSGCVNQPEVKRVNQKEDINMLMAIDSQIHNRSDLSLKYYHELYKITGNEQYLINTINYSFEQKEFELMKKLSKEGIENFKDEHIYFKRQLIVSLVGLKDYDEAVKKAKEILNKYPTPQNYEIVANTYYSKKDYKNALSYYESAYTLEQNESTLIKLAVILYTYLNQKDIALAHLETFIEQYGCGREVCDRLLLIYQEQGNIDGMLSILNKKYELLKQNSNLKHSVRVIGTLIVSLLERKDIKQAIAFLEKHKIDNTKLFTLYYQDGQLKKALEFTKELYKETTNPELLGRIAMLEFEIAEDKKEILKSVMDNFEKALSSGINNAGFQNYYGYLLIDYDVDVQKGVELVKLALKNAPNNIAYLDSLAWGYYKLGNCSEAYEVMNKVVKLSGLKDDEINEHWNKIKNCKEKK
ncbi:MAG: hypothetical protein U9Q04_07425 [Campylobacterota bacterium]|nr:hypothetical protein [Campylobacterota bacterium]